MLILGNSLTKGARTEAISLRTNLAVSIAKMVVMPLFGLLCGYTLKRMKIIPSQPDGPNHDAAFCLTAMIVTATPTANNLMIMAELAGENKEGLASCIFFQYMFAPVLLTIWL